MNVYDFDNTIYRGESAVDFFFYCLKKDPSLLRYIPLVAEGLWRYKRGLITEEKAFQKYSGYVTEYLQKTDHLEKDVERFWNLHLKNIKPFYPLVQNDDDVVVSCSPRFTMEPVCKRLGIKHLICSEVDPQTGEITRLCFREKKVAAWEEKYPGQSIDVLYTDSVNDKPLMEISRTVYLVSGNEIKKIKG